VQEASLTLGLKIHVLPASTEAEIEAPTAGGIVSTPE
jgi:hypothetical protein